MNLFSIIAAYDSEVRANRSADWDTVAAVANCEDGLMGAWGEVGETADRLYAGELSDAQYDALHDLFLAYQQALRVELAAERKASV